ncbi:MAG: RNA polymerase sigma factor, partial [Actinomycetia bacterium]|nr:RNA polymerase sigma factor [Actinomycetes bacterium]
YLVFNEGHTATAGASLTRPELTGEALRLGRLLVELLPGAAEPRGLLALMVLTEARCPARVDDGVLVRLADQDRNLWDRALVSEGQALVRSCLEQNEPGAYQVQAAIAAVHADAPNGPATDWSQIVVLYDHLLLLRPTDVVSLNRAIAVAELRGPAAGLAALSHIDLDGYHLIHAAPGEFLRRLGRVDEVRVALSRAIDMATNEVELRHLRAQLDSLPD